MNSLSSAGEAQLSTTDRKRATTAGLTLAGGGWMSNLIVYLIQEFNVKSINAAQISNIVNACTSLIPVLGAIIADSFFGCFSVVWISSSISLLGSILLALTAILHSLRPQPCENGSSTLCKNPSKLQFAVLYGGIALASIGVGGTRFIVATMGANQFKKPKAQSTFFNWYFFTIYTAAVLSTTAIVFIEDNVSWACGFGITVAANALGLAIFLLGNRFYHHVEPEGSPFTGLARVVVATIRKRKVGQLSSGSENYYHGHDGVPLKIMAATPTKSFRFLNRAALITEGDINPDGSIAKPWKLCTIQHVEDLKTLIRILPIWSSSIFLATPIGIQATLSILQALTMDRHIGPHFKFPAGSILVFVLVSTSISLTMLDRLVWPTWQNLIGRSPTPLQRIGVGHVLNVVGMVVSALVESKRLSIAQSHHFQGQPSSNIVPISVLWLVPQLVLVGIGEAFHFPGQVTLYYQEFPTSLKNLSTAIISLIIGIAFYLSTALIDLTRRVTDWLPDNINDGRLDNVYWLLVGIGVVNFGYYLICAMLYKYQSVENRVDVSPQL
ncbi:unnamed protein product [Ilex paraguariensis]|uniref:NPF family transporter n=1 Tax=Ilex paraguariensis TaxID=185542 RepID=A0ABC8TI66_9AQUA